MNLSILFLQFLSDLDEIRYRNFARNADEHFWVPWKWKQRRTYIYALKAKNALLKSVFCVTDYTICNPVIWALIEIDCPDAAVWDKPILPDPVCR